MSQSAFNLTSAPATRGRLATIGAFFLAASLLYVSRLPLLWSGRLVPDGDEAIAGLMALRLLDAGEVPVFFWGQNYGFATLETGVATIFFALFGVSATALKAAMLVLWAAGGAFLSLAARRLAGGGAGFAAIALLAASPAWGEWAMKARGGYLTAFLLSAIVIWALAPRRNSPPLLLWTALGAGVTLVYLAQPLWFLLLLPLLLLRAWEGRGARLAAAFACGAVPIALAGWLGRTASPTWAPGLFTGVDPMHALARLPSRLVVHFSGAYLFERSYLPDAPASQGAAAIWLLLLASLLLVQMTLPREAARPAAMLIAGMAGVALFSVFIADGAFGYRYLLPVSGALPLLLALLVPRLLGNRSRGRWSAGAALALLLGAGTLALMEVPPRAARTLPDDPYALEAGEVERLIAEMREARVTHVYSLDPLLQWNLMFASRGEVLARWLTASDRRPAIPIAIDAAVAGGAPVVLAARRSQAEYLRSRLGEERARELPTALVTRHLILLAGLTVEDLRALGFEAAGG